MRCRMIICLLAPLVLAGCQGSPDKTLEAIKRAGGTVTFDETKTPKTVVGVDLSMSATAYKLLPQLRAFPDLESCSVWDTPITDDDLKHLHGLTKLQRLNLGNTDVTDQALYYLRDMKYLRELHVNGTKFTAAGLQDLKRSLPDTKVFE